MIRSLVGALGMAVGLSGFAAGADVPRPEHPTPDAVRKAWFNLNGDWAFRFDPKDEGVKSGWERPGAEGFAKTIVVPFPWESELSGIKEPEYRGVAWYRREFRVPDDFPKNDHVWLRFGAVDWRADVWVNGHHVAKHEGGYTPFEADITEALTNSEGRPAVVVVRVFDPTDPSHPTGKQVGWYTPTSGIWQTVWLEARPRVYIADFAVTTEIDPARVRFAIHLAGGAPGKYIVSLDSDDATVEAEADGIVTFEKETASGLATLNASVKSPKLWTPETPHLYEMALDVQGPDGVADRVRTYFGLRTIARGKYGDAPNERVLLNGKPVYLRTALDQSFNPKGIYTAPDDAFLKHDIELAKTMGLNGLRIHIKPDEPRRLYWADKLGLLILEDMPNTWRQNAEARAGWEKTMREAVVRDRNHPSIVTWVAFNETWGLGSPPDYKKDKDTQEWVGRMVDAIRKLDSTRLVEDNSPCNYDHVENTDLNSWHFYIDEHREATRHIDEVVAKTTPGSDFNYCPGRVQGTAPLINSEYGGVSAGGGDRDVSWCFRDLTTLLRRQPKIQGYVYTELADIEWEHNGFTNYDRSAKDFGYQQWVPSMTPADLNGADFVGYEGPPVVVVKPGEKVSIPVFLSHFSDRSAAPTLRWWVSGWNELGKWENIAPPKNEATSWTQYDVKTQSPVTFTAPDRPFVGAVALTLRDARGERFAANFVNLVVKPETPLPRAQRVDDHTAALRFQPDDLARRHFSGGASTPPGKAYGRGKGYLEYRLKVPDSVVKAGPKTYLLRLQAASKAGKEKVDWPSRTNPQDYPQTDGKKWPSTLQISLNGKNILRQELEDDPADARGVLSHLNRFEHGSYGELVEASGALPDAIKADLDAGRPLVIRLSVPDDAAHAGGLCLFGAETGEFPLEPTLSLTTEQALPSDLGVKPDASVAVDRLEDHQVRLLGAGDSGQPSDWAYATQTPASGWMGAEFDDSAWQRGKAGFGTSGTPAIRVATSWNSARIWLRTTVEVPKLGADDSLSLHLFHDEDAEVFVNGKSLVRTRGYISSYRDIELSDAQRALFHSGKNTIAVSCRQTGGGQGIDVGMTLLRGE
jgi:Glycosyl hydrolases family 2, sugar binding domain/Glycosyl hydrolases family 2, TIM barrel domain/Glycosyl hydrolases family 2